MNPPPLIPFIPENAPFTPEQRAYLNGFFAGLFSRVPATAAAPGNAPAPTPLEPLAILFGSQTGNAERLARRLAREAGKHGFAPTIHELARYPMGQLAAERNLLIVTSTYGDGDPPDNAKAFWAALSANAAPRLNHLRFSVCALGDTNYAKFCCFGRQLDARLAQLGAARVFDRQDCDVDFEAAFARWQAGALAALASPRNGASPSSLTAVASPADPIEPAAPRYSKAAPYPARLLANRRLTGAASAKDVRHFVVSLPGPELNYEVGDALGVMPANDPDLVAELLRALGWSGDETVPGRDGTALSAREALLHHYEITRIPRPLLEAFAAATKDETLRRVSAPEANGELTAFLRGRDVIDLLLAHPNVRFAPAEFVGRLRPLQPRLYSISSSPKVHPGEVHLTVSVVRYTSLGRARKGVCSAFLAERVAAETPVPVYVHANPAFRPPAPDRPLIMVGPGTGIAPFRAFLEERRALGAKGRNWLFFGDQTSANDFLYREEIEAFHRDGLLTRLDLAWSRDQATKVYVQHKLLEHAADLYAWLEQGASFCVCGDASRMAKDVNAALREVVRRAGGRTAEQAAEYVQQLEAARRYVRDVY